MANGIISTEHDKASSCVHTKGSSHLTKEALGDTLYTQRDNGKGPMIKHLTPHGNSSALVIEKAILELLKIDTGTPLEIATDGKNLIVSPVKDARRETAMKAALDKVNKRHGKTLKKLAG